MLKTRMGDRRQRAERATARPATKGAGCLIVLDSNGKVAGTIAGDKINMPWGNMATIDDGADRDACSSATRASASARPRAIRASSMKRRCCASSCRSRTASRRRSSIRRSSAAASARSRARMCSSIGPTGLALGPDDTLYVSDATGNRISAIWDATTRDHSAGRRPDHHEGWPVAKAAGDGDRAERPSSGHQRQERPSGGDRSRQRRANQGAVDRPEQGAEAAGQRRSVRHRHDAGGRWFLLRRGRVEHARPGAR